MTGDDREPAWHERTGTLAGASIGALVALGLIVLLVSYVARSCGAPEIPAGPAYAPDPGDSSTPFFTTTDTSTTEVITSTSPPMTTDLSPDQTTTSGTDTSGTGTSPTTPQNLTPPHTRERTSTDESGSSTSRRPRFNITRTFNP